MHHATSPVPISESTAVTHSLKHISHPLLKKNAYKSTDGWRQFLNGVETEPGGWTVGAGLGDLNFGMEGCGLPLLDAPGF